MLVLTRRSSQQIRIGDNVTVTVLQIDGRTVRIGIDAPKQMPIVREEAVQRTVEVLARS